MSSSGRTVFALTKYGAQAASSRVRFLNLIPSLQQAGWQVHNFPFLPNAVLSKYYAMGRHRYLPMVRPMVARLRLTKRWREADIWWVEKELLYGLPWLCEMPIGRLLSRSVIDYDDAVFLKYQDCGLGVAGRAEKFRQYAQRASAIVVGSEFLRTEMRQRGARDVAKIPSTVFVSEYAGKEMRAEIPTIGWIGTPVTVHFLDSIRDVLTNLATTDKFRFRVVGATWSAPGVAVDCRPWTRETEADLVRSFDIGIMPLHDGLWERGKCGYKLVQYMAAGVVPVGSAIGENRHIIEHGQNGFLPETLEDWLDILRMLCRDPDLRERVGTNAREIAITHYDVNHAAADVSCVFDGVVSRLEEKQP